MRAVFGLLALIAAVSAARLNTPSDGVKVIPDQYIIVLNENVEVETHLRWLNGVMGATDVVMHKYNIGSFRGYAGRFSGVALNLILANTQVKYVDYDSMASIDAPILAPQKPLLKGGSDDVIAVGGTDDVIAVGGTDDVIAVGGTDDVIAVGGTDDVIAVGGTDDVIAVGGTDDFFAVGGTDDEIYAEQPNPDSWGIDRVDQTSLPLNQLYRYKDTAGEGVDAYIIDTGIYVDHQDYAGRVEWGANFVGDNNDNDCNGHGTHVAGTTAGTEYGIAKKAYLIGVKVLGCAGSGAWSGVIAGIDWATTSMKTRGRPAVGNMSLGGGYTQSVNDAVDASSAEGFIHVIAAGNNGGNTCNYSPASSPTGIAVGSSAETDTISSFSNRGTCMHIFAPGSNIKSTYIRSPTDTTTMSGTSMASPHVCGAAALLLAEGSYTPATMRKHLQDVSTKNALTGVPADTLNYLLFTEPPATL